MEQVKDLLSRLEEHPVWLFGVLSLIGFFLMVNLFLELKASQSLLAKKWNEYREMVFVLKNAPVEKFKAATSVEIRKIFEAHGLVAETLEDTPLGVETLLEVSWADLAKLLPSLEAQGYQIVQFQAQDLSGQGQFRLKMVVR